MSCGRPIDRSDVDAAPRQRGALGYVERASSQTDVVFLGLGIFVGGLFGALSVTVGGIPLSLTASGGALIMGLVFGWLRSVRPTFGRIPEPALWVFDTVGLAVFIGLVGIGAGPSFVSGLRTTGPGLLLVGFVVALTPHLVAVLFGRYVLKMNPSSCSGPARGPGPPPQRCAPCRMRRTASCPCSATHGALTRSATILLTAWGPVIVVLTQ
jgi:putative transport protein